MNKNYSFHSDKNSISIFISEKRLFRYLISPSDVIIIGLHFNVNIIFKTCTKSNV